MLVKEKKVGIVMPCYNASGWILTSISEILRQTYGNWQLFIVDDCSTDNTINLIKNTYADSRITFLSTTANSGGPSKPRNIALEHIMRDSSIRYVAYCDSDDVWQPNHLFRSIAHLETFPSLGMVYSQPIMRFDTGARAYTTGIADPPKFSASELLKGNYIYISTVVHKAECAKHTGYFDHVVNGIEDWDYWIRLTNHFSAAKISSSSVIYIVRTNGTTNASACTDITRKLFAEKRMEEMGQNYSPVVKLHLGCGDQILAGYTNCDLYSDKADRKIDCSRLPDYNDNSVDEIYACHLIEHFDFKEGQEVLKEWHRVLKPGGKLILETPDFLASCRRFVEGTEEQRVQLYGHFFAWPWQPGQCHKFLYTETQLTWTLTTVVGFCSMSRVSPDSIYANSLPDKKDLFLKVIATK